MYFLAINKSTRAVDVFVSYEGQGYKRIDKGQSCRSKVRTPQMERLQDLGIIDIREIIEEVRETPVEVIQTSAEVDVPAEAGVVEAQETVHKTRKRKAMNGEEE